MTGRAARTLKRFHNLNAKIQSIVLFRAVDVIPRGIAASIAQLAQAAALRDQVVRPETGSTMEVRAGTATAVFFESTRAAITSLPQPEAFLDRIEIPGQTKDSSAGRSSVTPDLLYAIDPHALGTPCHP